MKLINKHNFINVLCITYTIISLFACIFESIIYKEISHDHFNMLLMFILSIVSILVLSQQYRFDNIPTLILIIIQYLIALLCTTIIMLFLINMLFAANYNMIVIEDLLKSGYVPLDYYSSDLLIKKGIYFKLQ